VSHADPRHYQPTNITFGIMPTAPSGVKRRQERRQAQSARALRTLDEWIAGCPVLADAGAAP